MSEGASLLNRGVQVTEADVRLWWLTVVMPHCQWEASELLEWCLAVRNRWPLSARLMAADTKASSSGGMAFLAMAVWRCAGLAAAISAADTKGLLSALGRHGSRWRRGSKSATLSEGRAASMPAEDNRARTMV